MLGSYSTDEETGREGLGDFPKDTWAFILVINKRALTCFLSPKEQVGRVASVEGPVPC